LPPSEEGNVETLTVGNIISVGVGVAAVLFVVGMVACPNNALWEARTEWLVRWGVGRWYSTVWLTALAITGLVLIVAGLAGLARQA
jgi:hypothetical protein